MKHHYIVTLGLPLLGLGTAHANDDPVYPATTVATPITITASALSAPGEVRLDPDSPVQPIPAADGAGLLKTVPGISITRKGGMAGDPLLRGLGGSRLSVTSDGNYVLGGCAGRMDPPTAYLFPRSFDEVVITKGPQTVTQGPGLVAGSVQFKRRPRYYAEPGFMLDGGMTTGSADRFDAFAALEAGNSMGYMRLNANHNEAGNYQDGSGNRINSAYNKDSQSVQLGLTPDELSLLELSYDRSRGEAAYADRSMDGSKFDRDAWGVKLERQAITPWLSKLQLQFGHSEVDHVMDNYSLRPLEGMMYKAMNPDRSTDTARLLAELNLGTHQTQVGMDWMQDAHRVRMAMGMNKAAANAYRNQPRKDNQSFNSMGMFVEDDWLLSDKQRLISGVRLDKTEARFEQQPASSSLKEQNYYLHAGFVRLEHSQQDWTWYAGYGQAERAPDFWERNRNGELNTETNHQLDAGVLYRKGNLSGSVSVFAGYVDDFILVDNTTLPQARNINARRFGGEAEVSWRVADDWTLASNLSYTHGQNLSNDIPLGQTPPLELNTTLGYDNGTQEVALLMRNVAAQHRFAEGQGNIIGQDAGPSAGFTVFSLNAGWQLTPTVKLAAGIDNLLDKDYSEFINKQEAYPLGDNPVTGRISEPGRQWWAEVQISL
ncbi:TonB-dependent copper receptor [Oceanimonas baumannii]|uniref:TonB-dependent copper receptor n=1 Tax=Oceanimonas baumannii TaxID=129578 RepID=UPI001D1929EC|nr:TonB-dependent copper receptor [Oceanimonas baumannii]MCC4263312.1 TonB-dependent copper receptor [Oceanimonas baumannii]